jgi:uncharacterized membrane protein HdeD (DUF308 family)
MGLFDFLLIALGLLALLGAEWRAYHLKEKSLDKARAITTMVIEALLIVLSVVKVMAFVRAHQFTSEFTLTTAGLCCGVLLSGYVLRLSLKKPTPSTSSSESDAKLR